jgi:hypothetical protein
MAGICNTYVRNNETEKYVKRVKNAGKILDSFSVVDIDNFIGGCKDLGVWNSMVCWPLRSTQNTETNTALSLGGLGTYDGTLVNGPTWGINGINCGADWDTGSTIDIVGLDKAWSPATLGVVAYSGAGSFATKLTNPGPANFVNYMGIVTNYNAYAVNSVTLDISKQMEYPWNSYSSPSFCAISSPMIGATLYKDGTIASTSSEVETLSEAPLNHYGTLRFMSIGSKSVAPGGSILTGVIPFAFLCKQALSQNEWNTYRNLYKSTLGKGLGLP